MNHLYLMERAITKGISDILKGDDSIPAVDKPIELTLNREVKVQAPPFVIPSESYQSLSEVKERLSESRKAFVHVVDHAKEIDLKTKVFSTPFV
ncbi:hypothetical protein ACFQ9Y_18740 [Peribacillus simplex]|uniref:hypothetical protein n=1 Tax=Peribacillus simplex TaxID=1478 RepID=UPI0036718D15